MTDECTHEGMPRDREGPPPARRCLCSACDLALFRDWRKRIKALRGRSVPGTAAGKKRDAIMAEIRDSIGARYHGGIGVSLCEVQGNVYSDPVERRAADGRLVKPGHIGTIYRAHNGRFLGRGAPSTLRLLPDGGILAPRALAKIRARDRGWRYAAAQLERAGAAPLGERDDAAAWLARWLPALTRAVRHPGNLRYAWALQRGVALPEAHAFPLTLGGAA